MSKEIKNYINLHGCVIRDDAGSVIATLLEDDNKVITVIKEPACTLGMYLYLLSYLDGLGFDVK